MAYKSSVLGIEQRLFLAWKTYEGRHGRVTQTALAEMVGEGQPTLSDWFSGNRIPSLTQVETIARVLEVNPAWVAYEVGEMLAPGAHPPTKASQPRLTRPPNTKRA